MQTRRMETRQKQRSERFKRKALARWRLLAASGVSLEQAALEIGVAVVELRAWSRGVEVEAPLFVPVQVEGETVVAGRDPREFADDVGGARSGRPAGTA